jgi:hypothetical protein
LQFGEAGEEDGELENEDRDRAEKAKRASGASYREYVENSRDDNQDDKLHGQLGLLYVIGMLAWCRGTVDAVIS